MFLALTIVGYVIAHLYIIWRMRKWFMLCSERFKGKGFLITEIVIVTLCGLMTIVAFFLPISNVQRLLQRMSNYWVGVLIYTFMTIIIIDAIRLILRCFKRIPEAFYISKKTVYAIGMMALAMILTLSLYGFIHATKIKVKEYSVRITKEASIDELNAILVSDIHLGYSVGVEMVEQMVEIINSSNPDVVLFAGDIFDNVYDGIDEPERIIELLQSIETKYGMYACYGNHDVSERLFAGFSIQSSDEDYRDSRMDDFLKRAGVKVLEDEVATIAGDIYIIGRCDYSKPCLDNDTRADIEEITYGLDKSKPIIVLEHQPKALSQVADAGVDAQLSGHTHDGQFFPLNIAIDIIWENPYGYKNVNNMHSIVTSGVGVYGPFMRVGTDSEICKIQFTFEK